MTDSRGSAVELAAGTGSRPRSPRGVPVTRHRGYVWPAELDLAARLAGLELETRHAGWAGEPLTAESRSRSHVSVYRRPPRPSRPT